MQRTHVAHWAGEECARWRCRPTCVPFCRVFLPDAATLLTVQPACWGLMRHCMSIWLHPRACWPRWGHVCNEAVAGACDWHTLGHACVNENDRFGGLPECRSLWWGVWLEKARFEEGGRARGGVVGLNCSAARCPHPARAFLRTPHLRRCFPTERPAHSSCGLGSSHHTTCVHVYSLSAGTVAG